MITINEILISNDPLKPKRDLYELTTDKAKELDESFFSPGFAGYVTFSNGSEYSFTITKDRYDDLEWEFSEFISDGSGDSHKEFISVSTLFDALENLLYRLNNELN